ncbi:MAG: BatD family protein [Puniceicoccales bacterium]
MNKIVILWILLLLTGASGLRANIEVSSSFEPAIVNQGDPSLYRIDFSSDSGSLSFYNSAPPKIPTVEGLTFQYIGPSHETRFINGQGSVRTSHLFRAFAREPGKYVVPSFTFRNGSHSVEIPSATLEILKSTAPSPTGTGTGTAESTQAAWLEVNLPRETLYVGETTPIGIRLYLNSQKIGDASLRAEHPEKVGDAFSISEFGTMTQSQISYNGLPVTIGDWDALLTPLKTGSQPLIFELPLAVSFRNTSRANDPFQSMFGGTSPFQRMFSREGIRAYSEDKEIEILPLPTANRPDDFTGGIGSFQLQETRISSSTVQVGEPFLFSIEIAGEGNFDRLEPPLLQSDREKWKDYAPETTFTPRDQLSYSGVKSFTFTLVPQDAGIQSTPEFSFSYFDPENAEYKTVIVPPTTLTVNPAAAASLPPRKKVEASNPVEARRGPDLLPIQSQWTGGSYLQSLRSPFTNPGLWILQALLLLVLILSYLLLRHRARLKDDPDYAKRNRAKRASRRYLKEASTHASSGHPEAFYRSACRAIQESVGPYQSGEPESLTENDVIRILRDRHPSESTLSGIHHFFAAQESIQYGGRKAAQADLNTENQKLNQLAKSIHSRPSKRGGAVPPAAILLLTLALAVLATPNLSAQDTSDDSVGETERQNSGTTSVTDSSQARIVFDRAVDAYASDDFANAATDFESLLPAFSTAQVHYNLANTLYRLRKYPEAILHYEKAFALAPTNPDIQANRKLAREAASIEIPPPPPLAVIGHRLTWAAWTWLLALSAWGLVATALLAPLIKMANLWRNALILLFSLVLVTSILAQITWFSTANQAIALQPETALRIAPTASSPVEKKLPAGSSVKASEVYGDFIRVQSDDGTQGWAIRSDIARVRPD